MNYLKLLSLKSFQLNNILFKINMKSFSSITKLNTVKDVKRVALKKLDPNHYPKKNVLLYKNENTGFYQKLLFLNVLQFAFWVYISNFALVFYFKRPKKLTEEEIDEKLKGNKSSFARNKLLISENWKQVSLSLLFVTIGHISMGLIAMFTIRSVRYIILHSGGNKVRICCFSLMGAENRYRNHDIPLEYISAAQHRNSGGNYIPLKIKGKALYFLVDKKGHFLNPTLFDETVGVFRILK